MNMTLLRSYCTARAHEQAWSRVQPVLGGQSVVAIVGDYVSLAVVFTRCSAPRHALRCVRTRVETGSPPIEFECCNEDYTGDGDIP